MMSILGKRPTRALLINTSGKYGVDLAEVSCLHRAGDGSSAVFALRGGGTVNTGSWSDDEWDQLLERWHAAGGAR